METDDDISSHLQVLGAAVTMVTQDGAGGDGKELQPVSIMGWRVSRGHHSSKR